jgi:hypothetical protein
MGKEGAELYVMAPLVAISESLPIGKNMFEATNIRRL